MSFFNKFAIIATVLVLLSSIGNASNNGLYICYDTKSADKSKVTYTGCKRYRNSCDSYRLLHFGKYPTDDKAQKALLRCAKSSPKFINSGTTTLIGSTFLDAALVKKKSLMIYKNISIDENAIAGYIPELTIFKIRATSIQNWWEVETSEKYEEGKIFKGYVYADMNDFKVLDEGANESDVFYSVLESNPNVHLSQKNLYYIHELLEKYNGKRYQNVMTGNITELNQLYNWMINKIMSKADTLLYTQNKNDAFVIDIMYRVAVEIKNTLHKPYDGRLAYYMTETYDALSDEYMLIKICDEVKLNKDDMSTCNRSLEKIFKKNEKISVRRSLENDIFKIINDFSSKYLYQKLGKFSFKDIVNVGDSMLENKHFNKALQCYKWIDKNHNNDNASGRADKVYIYKRLANVYLKLKKLKMYKKYLNLLIDDSIKYHGKNSMKISDTYTYISNIFLNDKSYEDSYRYAKKSIEVFTKSMEKNFLLLNNKLKELYLSSNSKKISILFNSAYLNHNKSINLEMLNFWLNYKGSIFDSENAIAVLYANTKDENLKVKIKELTSLKRDLAKLYQTLPRPSEREAWSKKIKEIEAKIDATTKGLATKAESLKEQLGLKDISYKDIEKYLKPNELYIDFAKSDDSYYIFTLDSNSNIEFKQINTKDTKEIDSQILSFRDDIKKLVNGKLSAEKIEQLGIKGKEKLAKLYTLVLDPIKDSLKDKSSLIVSTDGALRLLPFEALYNGSKKRYLIEDKEIKYIPNGKEFVRLYRYAKKSSGNESVIFDDPDFDIEPKSKKSSEDIAITPNINRAGIIKSLFKMNFSPLPGTKKEAEHIKNKLRNVKEYTSADANEENLLKIKEPKILHIATHGFFLSDSSIPNSMLKSGIALAGANTSAIRGKSDGIVTSLKLSGLDLKGTNLVVLSACETGVVDINSTQSVSGLSKAFIQAGAKDIVMSLWSVDDNATQELMSSFYGKFKKYNNNYSKALKEAKLEMIKKNMHPFYWAAFVMSGM